MFPKITPNVSYFLAGLGIGSLIGILFAPKSGEETREYMMRKTREGSGYVQSKALELIQRGEEMVKQQQEQISTAIGAGREAYQRQKSKAQGA